MLAARRASLEWRSLETVSVFPCETFCGEPAFWLGIAQGSSKTFSVLFIVVVFFVVCIILGIMILQSNTGIIRSVPGTFLKAHSATEHRLRAGATVTARYICVPGHKGEGKGKIKNVSGQPDG